ncbi:hypothetical protein [Thiococcus pfennigii]|uniref:hypothetical protein n=1 Tax=Thiococcus pfennigii TaxID=1057 RepID=UPI001906E336|nr:hypothetical protein [Thiococcus pfennigii]
MTPVLSSRRKNAIIQDLTPPSYVTPPSYDPRIKRYYQRKRARTNGVIAIKTVAHKLARACFYILRDQVRFDVTKAFA